MFARRQGNKKETSATERILDRGIEGGDTRLATARWFRGDDLAEEARDRSCELYYSTNIQSTRSKFDSGTVYLGHSHQSGGEPVGWCDDRHLITVAGSRAGKGVSAILPNLHLYRGSMVCIDPKGENASITADHRANVLGQDVHVLDPYGVAELQDQSLRSTHDPMVGLKLKDKEIIEKINMIADSMIIPTADHDPHFDELARAFIAALVGHVLSLSDLGMPRNLVTLRALFRKGDPERALRFNAQISLENQTEKAVANAIGEDFADARPLLSDFEALLEGMSQNEALDGMISGLAKRLLDMGPEERGSVLSTTDRHTRFLDGEPMKSVLMKPQSSIRKHIDFEKLKQSKKPISIYLCLPTRYLSTHARWLRLLINGIMGAVEMTKKVNTDNVADYRIIAILDEFPVLGYMRTLESAIGYMAGYGIRIWAILQDLNQLKRDYPKSWETFLGNTGVQQFFGNTDHTTLDYLSKALGETEVIRTTRTVSDLSAAEKTKLRSGHKSAVDTEGFTRSVQEAEQIVKVPLMSPHEIRLIFRREQSRQIILSADFLPIVAYRRLYYEIDKPGQLLDELARRP